MFLSSSVSYKLQNLLFFCACMPFLRPGALNANCCTSLALITYFAGVLENARRQKNLEFASKFIKNLAEKAPSISHSNRGVQIGPLRVNSAGVVVNLAELISGVHHRAIKSQWDTMESLSAPFSPEISLIDLILFCLTVSKKRKSQRKTPWKGNLAGFISSTRQHLITFLSDLHHQVCQQYIANNPSCHSTQIPSRKVSVRR